MKRVGQSGRSTRGSSATGRTTGAGGEMRSTHTSGETGQGRLRKQKNRDKDFVHRNIEVGFNFAGDISLCSLAQHYVIAGVI